MIGVAATRSRLSVGSKLPLCWREMSRLAFASLVASLVLVPTVARADVATIYAQIDGGAGGGVGVGGAQKDAAFAADAPPGVYGVLVGAEFLFTDVFVEHRQLTDGSRVATWTQIAAGFDVDIELGAPPEQPGKPKQPGHGYVELGLYGGFGVGTGQQVSPPLSNDEVTDKGFFVEGRAGAGWLLGRYMRLGLTVPVSGGYYFKSGEGIDSNDTETHYNQIQAALLLAFRVELGVK